MNNGKLFFVSFLFVVVAAVGLFSGFAERRAQFEKFVNVNLASEDPNLKALASQAQQMLADYSVPEPDLEGLKNKYSPIVSQYTGGTYSPEVKRLARRMRSIRKGLHFQKVLGKARGALSKVRKEATTVGSVTSPVPAGPVEPVPSVTSPVSEPASAPLPVPSELAAPVGPQTSEPAPVATMPDLPL